MTEATAWAIIAALNVRFYVHNVEIDNSILSLSTLNLFGAIAGTVLAVAAFADWREKRRR